MKVMYVINVFAVWGGLERVWTDKMNALSEMYGYEICLVTTDQGAHQVPYPLSEKVRHIDLNIRFVQQYRYKGVKRLWKKIQKLRLFHKKFKDLLVHEQPDIIITNTSDFADYLVNNKGDARLVVESHGMYDRPMHMKQMKLSDRVKLFFHFLAIGKADRVIALTSCDAEMWRASNPRVCVIPNIVHLNESETYSSLMEKRVIFVGRVDSQKGYQYLDAVWQIVEQRHPDWSLEVYGEDATLEKNAVMMPKGKNVHIHSEVADILEKYKEHSMLLLTSVYEPFGLVMPEAMSCGLPVVAFDCPCGPSDIITDGEDGYLVKCFNTEDFADKVCMLIEDVDLRRRMGRQAISSSQRFKKETIMPMWSELFDSLVQES